MIKDIKSLIILFEKIIDKFKLTLYNIVNGIFKNISSYLTKIEYLSINLEFDVVLLIDAIR